MSREQWVTLGSRRILSVLGSHTVCSLRTLENKIADAGPGHMRVHPHILTESLRDLRETGRVRRIGRKTGTWYTLPVTSSEKVNQRLAELEPIQEALSDKVLIPRVGQALEIAIYRALTACSDLEVLGGFTDLEDHGDERLYSKEEPPSMFRSKYLPVGKLDFLIIGEKRVAGGVEVKNGREWIYPQRTEVKALLNKCCTLDIVPILIGRRLHYTTTRLLVPRGGLVRETYFQRLPASAADLAERAKDKHLLGYHDIRLGNEPDDRMYLFAAQLASLLPSARSKFDAGGRDALRAFAQGQITLEALGLGL
jgi:hypothetical protein